MAKRWRVKWDETEIPDGDYVRASDYEALSARVLAAARIFMAVRTVFGPVSYTDDAEGETWAKIDDWLTIKHSATCEFKQTGNCTCSQSDAEAKR